MRRILPWLILACLAPALALPPPAEAGPTRILKAASLAPKRVGWVRQVDEILIPSVTRCTQGEVGLKIYYGGIMGDDQDFLDKMRNGVLQAAGLSSIGTFHMCRAFGVMSLPFLFSDYGEVDFIRRKMFDEFSRRCEASGFRLFLWVDQDFDRFFSRKGPLVHLEDFRSTRFAGLYESLDSVLYAALSAPFTPMDVPGGLEALRQGSCDATLAPALFVLGSGLQGIARTMNPLPIRYAPATLVLSNAAWDSLSPRHRECLLAERESIQQAFCRASRQDTEQCLASLRQYGVNQEPMDPQAELALKVALKRSWNDLSGDVFPPELLARILSLLEEFRGSREKNAP